MPRSYELLPPFIIGVLAPLPIVGIIWALTGAPPPWWASLLGGYLLTVAGAVFFAVRRKRERLRLQADFDRPAFGEDHH